jgi:hypothetical protein
MDDLKDRDLPAHDPIPNTEGWNDELSLIRVTPTRYRPAGAWEHFELSLGAEQLEDYGPGVGV